MDSREPNPRKIKVCAQLPTTGDVADPLKAPNARLQRTPTLTCSATTTSCMLVMSNARLHTREQWLAGTPLDKSPHRPLNRSRRPARAVVHMSMDRRDKKRRRCSQLSRSSSRHTPSSTCEMPKKCPSTSSAKELPPCPGPKLNVFQYQSSPIKWMERLDDDREEGSETEGYVFRAKIRSRQYAIKVVSCIHISSQ